jgi:beta-glucanase (GH16 family)
MNVWTLSLGGRSRQTAPCISNSSEVVTRAKLAGRILRFAVTALLIGGVLPREAQSQLAAGCQDKLASSPSWQLFWSDEFNGEGGSAPDPAHWTYDIGNGTSGWGNHELENYTASAQNVQLDGSGHLLITAIKATHSDGSSTYTSGRIKTRGRFNVQYGAVEGCMKLPWGAGLWPAFWMLGSDIRGSDNSGGVPWPASGEIDIMENVASLGESTIRSTLWGLDALHHPWQKHKDYRLSAPATISNGFHMYGLIWSQNMVSFFVDNPATPFFAVTPQDFQAAWAFNQPFFILLNLAVAGDWPGSPGPSTAFPSSLVVDYVRVYKHNFPRSQR